MIEEKDNAAAEVEEETFAETHEQVSVRRSSELDGLLDGHRARVTKAQKDYPVPIGVKFANMDLPAQLRWNQRAEVIKRSAQSYHAAVRAACVRHRADDVALTSAHLALTNAHLEETI